MKVLIKERLSPNKYVTPEGYLICKDAILARTGKQQYRKSEVFDTFDGDDDIIDIDRNPKEVFSDATLASFENKPITVEHPQENVDSTNWKQYQVGFVRDVKRDVVDGQDVILGTLVIQDKDTIDEILNGEHTDLSCGYECDITGDDKTGYSQINIRGNHVALCQEGRAGIARIVDSKVEDSVNDSDELVVGKWYEFAKKIEVARNQYAKSLRISGKSGDVYKYTIYLKNGEVYGSGTYSEIKERFNIKDSIVDSNIVDTSMTVTTQVYVFNGHDLLIQNRKGHAWHGLAVPGGHVKHDEPAMVSAIREVKEETGLDVKDLVLFGTHQYTCPEDGESIAMLYYTTKFSGELKSSEEGEMRWMNIEDVLENPDVAEGFTELVHKAWTKVKNLVKDSSMKKIRYGSRPSSYKKVYFTVGTEEEDDIFNNLSSISQAKSKIRELKRFDKQEGIEASYYINQCYETEDEVFINEVYHDSINDDNNIVDSFDMKDFDRIEDAFKDYERTSSQTISLPYDKFKNLVSEAYSLKNKIYNLKVSCWKHYEVVKANYEKYKQFSRNADYSIAAYNGDYPQDVYAAYKQLSAYYNIVKEECDTLNALQRVKQKEYEVSAGFRDLCLLSYKEIIHDKQEENMKDADKYSFRLIKKKNEYDEFCVKCYKNGKYYEDGSYYTDDWQDAVDTIKAMAKRANLEVKQNGNSFIADCNNSAVKDADSSDLTYFEELLERNNIRFRKISRSSYSGLESQFGKIEKLAKRLNLNVRFEKGGSGHFTVDCDNTDCNDSFVEEPRAKDELIKALSDYKLTDEGKTFTGRTHCQFESTKKFDRSGFDKEARRIIALVKNIENKYNIPDTTYNIGMRNDGTIVAVVDLGRKYVEDSKIKDSIKHSTLINLTKIVKIIKNNKR